MTGNVLRHPTLNCTIVGKPSGSTIQFRNLKFAKVPGRWQDSILNDTLDPVMDGCYDATYFGPSCPHKRGAQAWDLTLIGAIQMPFGEGHRSEEESMNEFECLHATVTVPKSVLRGEVNKEKGLPVFVWVHGGGLSMGSNTWPQYNLTRFVERSVGIGKPVIGVSINYRVGILGFLASEELGIDGNFGYKDQVVGFRWVKKYIAGFGGDPRNVTAAGESAGAISLSTLLCADVGEEGLFERVVIMSGDATLRKPRVKSWHEIMYHEQLKLLGLQDEDVKERKKKLKEMDATKMTTTLPLAQHFCACVDGKFLKTNLTLELLSDGESKVHKPDWCKEFVIGDTAHDGTILHGRVLTNPQALDRFGSACAQHLSTSETASLLSAYRLSASDLADSKSDEKARNMNELISDLRFHIPTLEIQRGWKASSKNSGQYHFHALNPIQGTFTNLASHELDVAFLLQNFNEFLDVQSCMVARDMSDKWIRFINGESWCEGGKVVVIEKNGVLSVDEDKYDMEYRGGRVSVLQEIDADKLWKLAEEWQGVRSERSQENGVKNKL